MESSKGSVGEECEGVVKRRETRVSCLRRFLAQRTNTPHHNSTSMSTSGATLPFLAVQADWELSVGGIDSFWIEANVVGNPPTRGTVHTGVSTNDDSETEAMFTTPAGFELSDYEDCFFRASWSGKCGDEAEDVMIETSFTCPLAHGRFDSEVNDVALSGDRVVVALGSGRVLSVAQTAQTRETDGGEGGEGGEGESDSRRPELVVDQKACVEACELGSHLLAAYACTFSQDSSTVFSGGADFVVRAWKYAAEEAGVESVGELAGHTSRITSLSRASNGNLISAGADGQVIVWDSAKGESVCAFAVSEGGVAAAVGGDSSSELSGLVLAGTATGDLVALDPRSGQQVFTGSGYGVFETVTASGNYAAGGLESGGLVSWDVRQISSGSMAELYTASLGSAALCSSVSLGGGKAVFGTADGRLFALALDGEIGPFTSPPAFFTGSNYEPIRGLEFNSELGTLGAGCRDSTLRLYDVGYCDVL